MKETKEIAYGILSQGYQVVMKFQTAENKKTPKSKSVKGKFLISLVLHYDDRENRGFQ